MTYIRSMLDQSAVVWHSSLTRKNTNDLERVQKVAVRIILGKYYNNYNDGISKLKIEKVEKRRENMCLKFAENCLKNSKLTNIFPRRKNLHMMRKRTKTTFNIKMIKNKRFKKSAVPYMTKLLNKHYNDKFQIMKN